MQSQGKIKLESLYFGLLPLEDLDSADILPFLFIQAYIIFLGTLMNSMLYSYF